MASTLAPARGDPLRLARALCHELGNLLAAVRLSAYLAARERDREAVAENARDVDVAAAQAGAVLALLPPLLAPPEGPGGTADPGQVLHAVEATLRRAPGLAARVDLEAAAGARPVRGDAEVLHHLLVALALSAWEAGGPAAPELAVRAEAARGGMLLAVEDAAGAWPQEEKDPRRAPRGRALLAAVAATLAARWGGEVRVRPRPGGSRVEVRLPAGS